MALCLVCIVTLKGLFSSELTQRLFDGPELLATFALDVQLDVVEGLVAPGLVVDVYAFNVILHLALKETLDGTIHGRSLHLLLQPVAEYPVQLLRIMLCEGVHGVPAEGLHQLAAVHRLVGGLELVEDVLQSLDERGRAALALLAAGLRQVLRVALLAGALRGRLLAVDGVDDPAELAHVEQALEEAIHVASSSVVLQANVARILLAVVVAAHVDAVSLPDVARRAQAQRVLRAEPAGLLSEL
mmetsp:Transcript_92838/g.271756  ORF Transcript_92838/g.271756 Transcript_92838/m.271756 type:complete len:243 (-) Transcript_92838:420-1148(-)